MSSFEDPVWCACSLGKSNDLAQTILRDRVQRRYTCLSLFHR